MKFFNTSADRKSVDALRRLDVFRELTFKEALEVSELLHERIYEKGEIIFEQGDIGHGIYVVISGKVRVDSAQESWKGAVVEFGPGEMLGELSLFEEAPRMVTAVAAERAVVVALFRTEFFSLLTANTKIGMKILVKIAGTMCRRTRLLLLDERHHPSV
jgi:CRP/FNR family transcriptional regulator